jgi:hypothetical protein
LGTVLLVVMAMEPAATQRNPPNPEDVLMVVEFTPI